MENKIDTTMVLGLLRDYTGITSEVIEITAQTPKNTQNVIWGSGYELEVSRLGFQAWDQKAANKHNPHFSQRAMGTSRKNFLGTARTRKTVRELRTPLNPPKTSQYTCDQADLCFGKDSQISCYMYTKRKHMRIYLDPTRRV